MRCHQCEKPAMLGVDKTGPFLCLDHAHKLQSMQAIQFLQSAAMTNMALQEMDDMFPFAQSSGRFPVEAIAQAMRGGTVLNNISISNSKVGVLNTGDLARIDAVITVTKGTDVEGIGDQLQTLTQSIIDASELDDERKKEILDLLQSLGDQVIRDRKPSVMRALLKAIKEPLHGIAAIVAIVDGLSASIERLFG